MEEKKEGVQGTRTFPKIPIITYVQYVHTSKGSEMVRNRSGNYKVMGSVNWGNANGMCRGGVVLTSLYFQ